MFKPNATASRYLNRDYFILFLMVLLVMLLPGCMSGSESENRAQGSATLKVTVDKNQNQNKLNKAVQNKLDNAEIPPDIDSIVIQVTDESGTTLGEGDILAAGGEIELTVPPGIILTVTGLAYASGTLNFQAQTSVAPLLAGMSTSVELTLLPAGANASPLNVPIQIDTTPNGLSGNALSSRAVFSDNNQAVLFKSEADNLVTGDTNGEADFFLKDRGNNRVVNIHTDSNNDQADGAAIAADMSADGRVIVFESEAKNLATNPIDTNAASDVFVKALDSNTTTRISLTSNKQQAPLGSFQPTISDDGQLAAFVSENSLTPEGTTGIYLKNLPGDTLQYLGAGIKPLLSGDGSHIIIWDDTTNTLKLHNIANKTNIDITTPYAVPDASVAAPYDINNNGQFIAFALQSNNTTVNKALIDSTTLNSGIYLYENTSNNPTIRLISTDSEGLASDTSAAPAITPSISGEGRYIVYAIGSTIHVKDRITDQAAQLAQAGTLPSLSKEGRWVAYTISGTDNLYMVPNPLFGAGSDSPDTPATQLLNITLEGEGAVNSQDGNIACGEQCSYNYPDGTLVQLEAIAQANIAFTTWEGDCAGTEPIVQVTLDQARSCTAVFSPLNRTLMLTITGGPNAGSVRSNDGNDTDPPTLICENTEGEQSICNGEFPHNQSVTLIPILGNDKNDVSWTGCDEDNGLDGCTLLMNDARNVTANFILVEHTLTITKKGAGQGVVTTADKNIDCGELCSSDYPDQAETTLTATPAAGSLFAGWSGQCSGNDVTTSVTLTENSECIATFDLEEITFSVSKSGNGSGTVSSENELISCGTSCSATMNYGQTLILTANAASNSVFKEWQGACKGTNSRIELTLIEESSCTAVFDLTKFSLSTSTTGNGSGTITSDDQGINCGGDCNETYATGSTVTLTANATDGSQFTGWSGAEQCKGTQPSVQLTVNGNLSCQANFVAIERTLTVVSSNGVVTSSPPGISCGDDCSESYTDNEQVALTATPNEGYRLVNWSGSCSGTAARASVTMDADKSCTATFAALRRTLTVEVSGNGSVTSPPIKINVPVGISRPGIGVPGISCGEDCSDSYANNEVVTLTAVANEGHRFVEWSGSCSGTATRADVTMDADKSCTATFAAIRRTLTVEVKGNGFVTSQPVTTSPPVATSLPVRISRLHGISCGEDCSESYANNEQVTLTAVANEGYGFDEWSGSCSGTATRADVTMDADKSCTATFEDLPNVD